MRAFAASARDRRVEDEGLPARREDEPHQHLDGRRLAGAVRPDEAEDLALLHRRASGRRRRDTPAPATPTSNIFVSPSVRRIIARIIGRRPPASTPRLPPTRPAPRHALPLTKIVTRPHPLPFFVHDTRARPPESDPRGWRREEAGTARASGLLVRAHRLARPETGRAAHGSAHQSEESHEEGRQGLHPHRAHDRRRHHRHPRRDRDPELPQVPAPREVRRAARRTSTAWFKAEESLRQGERNIPAAVAGAVRAYAASTSFRLRLPAARPRAVEEHLGAARPRGLAARSTGSSRATRTAATSAHRRRQRPRCAHVRHLAHAPGRVGHRRRRGRGRAIRLRPAVQAASSTRRRAVAAREPRPATCVARSAAARPTPLGQVQRSPTTTPSSSDRSELS